MYKQLNRLRHWWSEYFVKNRQPLTEIQHAQALIAAIDVGGIPLNPLRVNAIARSLGLDVSRRAPVEETIARIRAVLQRT